MPGGYFFRPDTDANRSLNRQTRRVAALVPWRGIVAKRRANYEQLARAVSGVEAVAPLYRTLPEGVCPLSLPLLVPNRDACVAWMQARGIEAYPWWAGFHRAAFDWTQFPDAIWLKHNLLTLPIHQGMARQHLDYVAENFAQAVTATRHAERKI